MLKLYNVVAERGQEDSRTYQNRGLVYRVLDDNGNKIGAPIKASAFYNKPTLNNLEKMFVVNEIKRQEHKKRVTIAIDFALAKRNQTLAELVKSLQKEQISIVLRQNGEGTLYGITYVDLRTKCVFNGSDLGKQYSAKGIVERCAEDVIMQQKQSVKPEQQSRLQHADAFVNDQWFKHSNDKATGLERALNELLKAEYQADYVPHQLKKKRRKRQRHL